ncbi:MAG: hypothetical protein ACSHXL_05130 [Bacteroidota bacterium]
MDTITHATLILSVLTCALFAQSDVGDKPVVKKDKQPVVLSSAQLNDENRDQWISDMRNKLTMTTQMIGPFGKLQVEPEKKLARQQTKKKVAVKSDAFKKAVDAIKVNAVNSARGRFFIGSREFTAGDIFPIVKGGNTFKTEVISIKSSSIEFQNVNTKEYVVKNLFDLPKGMMTGSSFQKIDGVTPSNANDTSPLNLD